MKVRKVILACILSFMLVMTSCANDKSVNTNDDKASDAASPKQAEERVEVERGESLEASDVPKFNGEAYTVVNDSKADFSKGDLTSKSYEKYSQLDSLGRCGVAEANVGKDIMPKEKRGAIGQVKPTGWHTVRYDSVIPDRYLYNRCHLIGYQLTGENANEENLITGTRFLNVEGMLPFEDQIADYVKSTGNHVLYRVTPIFEGDNLVASGVQMEAMSVEDNGKGVCFNIYAYNNQPSVVIDYETGESHLDGKAEAKENAKSKSEGKFVCNINTKKYHRENCPSVGDMSGKNKKVYKGKAQSLIDNGYSPCKNCNP